MPKYESILSPSNGVEFNSVEHLPLVVYSYPKDNTPGYTTEGLDFNARLEQSEKPGYTVVGTSYDGVKPHQNFRTKQSFRFELLSDKDETVCKLFDATELKKLYGKESFSVERSTFALNAEGEIMYEWRKAKVGGHAQEVLEILGGQWRGRLKT